MITSVAGLCFWIFHPLSIPSERPTAMFQSFPREHFRLFLSLLRHVNRTFSWNWVNINRLCAIIITDVHLSCPLCLSACVHVHVMSLRLVCCVTQLPSLRHTLTWGVFTVGVEGSCFCLLQIQSPNERRIEVNIFKINSGYWGYCLDTA